MFSLDWTSLTIGYVVGIMMYHSVAFLIIPNDRE
jgi:uncharacterized membrane protein